ncbi:diguanylate cyclase domain-containing protein [Methylobacterium sp. NEAU K]|uniref:diguanylate cyclase domain-containing protein n=1 Tax=Methylobacterium sp. NEAU K TaxID=3064946 RepID=UPI00273675F3|nr:diguanylate cyclase [Methylobacterium sp. NEAU K]MDP4004408.1 diguanylate cyclase [Methylobacterium sp. NEAU K]
MYPVHPNELERLRALHDLDVLDSGSEPQFDAICRTAQALFGVPIALVSLVSETEQRFKGTCGLGASGTPREASFCTYAILSDEVLVVEDARQDERFTTSPLVTGEPHIRFYAGAPLVLAPGIHLGSLCIIDRVPRSLSPEHQEQLRDLAHVVVAQLRLRRAEHNARESAAKYRLLADNSTDLIIRSDMDGTRRYVSPAAGRLLGYEPQELLGTHPLDFVHPDETEAYARLLKRLETNQITQAVTQQRYRRRDGSWLWVEISFSLTPKEITGEPDGYVAVIRDISQRKDAEQRMTHMARHDPLTGLPNRLLFREQLEREIARTQRRGGGFGLFCLDLDRFKPVNDTLGHQAGDKLLCAVANRLKGVLRAEDMVARLGGDEFVIIQTGRGQAEEAVELAERLLRALDTPIDLGGYPVRIGISIGIALAPEDGLEPDHLYTCADRALYHAKNAGRNTFRLHGAADASLPKTTGADPLSRHGGRTSPGATRAGLFDDLFTGLLQTSPDCVKLVGADGRLLFISAGGQRTLQITDVEPLLGQPWIEFWEGEHREAAQTALTQAQAGSAAHFRGYCPTRKGQPRWWDVSLSPIRSHTGSHEHILVISRDITAQVEQEAERRTTLKRHEALIEATGMMVWRADPAGSIIESYGWEAYTGQAEETYRGHGWLDVVHPDDREGLVANWQALIASGQPGSHTYRVRRSDGQYRWTAARAVPLKDEAGQIQEWVGIATDIHERHEAAETIRRQEERYRLAVMATQDGIWDWDLTTDHVAWVEATGRVLNHIADATKPSPSRWLDRIHPEDRERVRTSFYGVVRGTETRWRDAYRYRADDGGYAEVIDRGFVIRDDAGEPLRMVGAVRDVTEQRQATAALRTSEERLRLALKAGRLVAWEQNALTGIVTRTGNASDLLGLDSATQAFALDRVHPDDRAAAEGFIAFGGTRDAAEFRYIHPTGAVLWLAVRAEQIHADRLVGVTFDITERKLAEEQVWRCANHDALTGLPNRRLFQQRLDQALAEAEANGTSVSLLLLDLDTLKEVNETLGHDAGDAVLCEAASRLSAGLRPCDTVARLAGDEFALILVAPLRLENAATHAAALNECLRRSFRHREHVLACRASIGLAAYPEHHRDPRELLKAADIALSRAKVDGRGRAVVFTPDMRAEANRRVTIAREVWAALDAGQIVPFYQPKVCFSTGAIVGFEALARWQHPEKGLLTPGYFGSAFDDPELATALGASLLRQVAEDMRDWNARRLSLGRVAMNFSSAEFRKPDLAGTILAVLNAFEVPPAQFEVEVTETVFLGHGSECVPATLRRLSESGVTISLDDFGTGFASLTHLKQFPVAHIKVDQSFVRDLERDEGDAAIVAAVISLGRSLGMQVTAEGVETAGQARRLGAMGCDYAQGFLYAKPMAGSRVPWLINTWDPAACVGRAPGGVAEGLPSAVAG